jgi:hypothetical protein
MERQHLLLNYFVQSSKTNFLKTRLTNILDPTSSPTASFGSLLADNPHGAACFFRSKSHMVNQELPNILLNTKLHCCVNKSPELALFIARWIHSIPLHYQSKMHFNVTLQSTPVYI